MDIDIDFQTSFSPSTIFKHAVKASMVVDEELKPHQAGYYFQQIPRDRITGLAAIPYEKAEELGYIKIDFLHLALLNEIKSKQQLRELMDKEPDWNLLLDEDIVKHLFQIGKHFDIIQKVKPKSVQQLADCIALIRPGKKQFLKSYLKNKDAIRPLLYAKPEAGGYYYKKPHAVAYALTIIAQLNIINK
jgi:hypothetical protein